MIVVLMCLAVVASFTRGGIDARSEDRPNFLLITSEDMSPDLGCYGDAYATTPNLDALARRGNRYSAAYANAPICSPARTALLFGMHQTSLGAGNHRSTANTPEGLLGFASHLREAGYFCTNSPKVDYNTPRAWEIERATYDRGRDWREAARGDRPFLSIINLAVSHQSFTSVLPYERYRTDVRAKLPPELLHEPDEALVPPYFPDTPAVRAELARYADCVTLMDRRAGEILRTLEADGLADSTIVLYFSDHGAGHPRHKSTPYASGLRVPLIVACPPRYAHLLRAAPGEVCDDVVTFIDIGPTLLNIAGVPIPAHMHGAPFLGEGAGSRDLGFAALDRRAESLNLSRTVTDGRYVYIRNYMPHIPIGQPKGYGFPSAIYQELARRFREGRLPEPAAAYLTPSAPEMLFDLRSDPFETVNLVGRPGVPGLAGTLERFRAAHAEHVRTYRDLGFVPEETLAARAAGSPWIDLADELPLVDIYDAADLVGRGPGVLERQLGYLEHPDGTVRWWAVIGLRSQDWSTARVRDALAERMTDVSPTVRVEAASAILTRDGAHREARVVLLEEIASSDPRVAHRAARAAQLLRRGEAQFREAVESASDRHRTEWLREVASAIRRQQSGRESWGGQ